MCLEAQRLVRADRQAAFLWYLEIDLVRLAALLFLVQVQDPHVGSSAACEEQKMVKTQNVILALLPRGALTVRGSRTGAAQTLATQWEEGPSLSSTHTSPGRRQTLCPAGSGSRPVVSASCGSPNSIFTPTVTGLPT